jgi:hypothetical protein
LDRGLSDFQLRTMRVISAALAVQGRARARLGLSWASTVGNSQQHPPRSHLRLTESLAGLLVVGDKTRNTQHTPGWGSWPMAH